MNLRFVSEKVSLSRGSLVTKSVPELPELREGEIALRVSASTYNGSRPVESEEWVIGLPYTVHKWAKKNVSPPRARLVEEHITRLKIDAVALEITRTITGNLAQITTQMAAVSLPKYQYGESPFARALLIDQFHLKVTDSLIGNYDEFEFLNREEMLKFLEDYLAYFKNFKREADAILAERRGPELHQYMEVDWRPRLLVAMRDLSQEIDKEFVVDGLSASIKAGDITLFQMVAVKDYYHIYSALHDRVWRCSNGRGLFMLGEFERWWGKTHPVQRMVAVQDAEKHRETLTLPWAK